MLLSPLCDQFSFIPQAHFSAAPDTLPPCPGATPLSLLFLFTWGWLLSLRKQQPALRPALGRQRAPCIPRAPFPAEHRAHTPDSSAGQRWGWVCSCSSGIACGTAQGHPAQPRHCLPTEAGPTQPSLAALGTSQISFSPLTCVFVGSPGPSSSDCSSCTVHTRCKHPLQQESSCLH